MSRLQEQARNLGITEDQCKEFKVSGLSDDEYKKLIKDSEDTLLTEEQRQELRKLVEKNEEYTILDYMKDKKIHIPGVTQDTKDVEKFEELLDQITPIEIVEKKEEIVEVVKKEYDRVNIKMEKELYDKVIYAAYNYDKDVTAFVTELLAKYLEKVEVDQDVVEKIRAKNKSRRAGN